MELRNQCGLLFLIAVSAYAVEAPDLFKRAIDNDSTAPNYVLITVVNDKTGKSQLTCTVAPFLLGAIHRERLIPYDAEGVRKVKGLALAQKDKIFHFSRKEALDNVTRDYSDEILIEMRTALKNLSDQEIRSGFRGDGEGLDKLYIKKSDQYSEYRDAIAHVLLERNLLPRRGCYAGNLTVEE